MADIVKETLLSGDQAVDLLGHVIVPLGELADFIVSVAHFRGDAHIEVSLRGFAHGPFQLSDRAGEIPGEHAGDQSGCEHDDQRSDPERGAPEVKEEVPWRTVGSDGKERERTACAVYRDDGTRGNGAAKIRERSLRERAVCDLRAGGVQDEDFWPLIELGVEQKPLEGLFAVPLGEIRRKVQGAKPPAAGVDMAEVAWVLLVVFANHPHARANDEQHEPDADKKLDEDAARVMTPTAHSLGSWLS